MGRLRELEERREIEVACQSPKAAAQASSFAEEAMRSAGAFGAFMVVARRPFPACLIGGSVREFAGFADHFIRRGSTIAASVGAVVGTANAKRFLEARAWTVRKCGFASNGKAC